MKDSRTIEFLGNGFFWVGTTESSENFQCNPYILIEGDEAVLFDPGSVLDYEEVLKNVQSLVPLSKVRYVVLSHQDPDVASAVPLMEKLGMRFTVVTHWRTWSLVRFYGLVSDYYLVDEHGYSLTLATGRILRFIHTPYLHFVGSIVTYDRVSSILVSGDLFGAFGAGWSLYAGGDYLERMKAFHEHYMPSSDILRPVMELFLRMKISIIAPQHGSIINSNISDYILALRDLECGVLARVIRRDLAQIGGYSAVVEPILKRFVDLFGLDAYRGVAARMNMKLDPVTNAVLDYGVRGEALWHRLFESIYLEKGMEALNVLDPFMQKICTDFSIRYPDIYRSSLLKTQKETGILTTEIGRLTRLTNELNETIDRTQKHMMTCPVTGLYNESFFRNYIKEESTLKLSRALGNEPSEDSTLLVVGVDEGMSRIEYQYGPREVEEILRGIAKILNSVRGDQYPAFRLHGASFALWLPGIALRSATQIAENIRTLVENSGTFIERVTVSAGLVSLSEIRSSINQPEEAGAALHDVGIRRLRSAKKRGGNLVVTTSATEIEAQSKGLILVVDDDRVNVDVLRSFLENSDYRVLSAEDGVEALKLVEKESPDLVIAEIMIPKMDAFGLKENMALSSTTKDMPFIILSHLKDESTVIRACGLGIDYYIKKPYMMSEVLGVVGNLLKKRARG